jgi:hypothetical protein
MRETLDAVPQRSAFYEQLQKIYGEASPEYYALQVRAGQVFAIKKQPPLQQPMLVALTSVDDPASERVILDPKPARSIWQYRHRFLCRCVGWKKSRDLDLQRRK